MMKFIPFAFVVLMFHASAMFNEHDEGVGYGRFAQILYNGYMADRVPGSLSLPKAQQRYGFVCQLEGQVFVGIHGTQKIPGAFKNAYPTQVLPGFVHDGYWRFYKQYIAQQTVGPIMKILNQGVPAKRIILGGYGMWGALVPLLHAELCSSVRKSEGVSICSFTLGSPAVFDECFVQGFAQQNPVLDGRASYMNFYHQGDPIGQLGHTIPWMYRNQIWYAQHLEQSYDLSDCMALGATSLHEYVQALSHCSPPVRTMGLSIGRKRVAPPQPPQRG